MSNFINLAMQNSQAEEARKRRKKAEMEDALLSGGSGGSSGSSSSQSINDESSNQTSQSYLGNNLSAFTGSRGSLLSTIANSAKDIVVDAALDTAVDKIGDVVEKNAAKMLDKAGDALEKFSGKIGSEALEKVANKVGGELVEKAVGKVVGVASNPYLAGAMMFKDGMDIVSIATTGKDTDELLSEDIPVDIDKEEKDLYQQAIDEGMSEAQAINLSNQAYAGLHQAQGLRDVYQGVKGLFSKKDKEDENKAEEEKKKKEIEEAEQKRKEAEEKIKKDDENKNAVKESEEDEYEEDEEGDVESDEAPKTALSRGVKSGLLHTAGTLGSSAVISFSMIGMYRVHYMGEFEYKGIGAEYQSVDKNYQNFTTYDKDGNVVLTGLSKENKLMKTFYTKYSDKSYYAVVEDSKKYSNIDDAYKRKNLLTPDELREKYPHIEDINGREVMFQINPDVLYALDKYIHNDSVLYPQQFVKPVYYGETKDTFELKNLLDSDGRIVAKSQEFDSTGKPLKNDNGSFKKTTGIWDYGFAPILRYEEHEVPRRKITNPVKRDIDSVAENVSEEDLPDKVKIITKAPESGGIPGVDSVTVKIANREKPAYIIDTAITPGGTIKNEIEKQWVRDTASLKTSSDTFKQAIKVKEEPKYCPIEEENIGGEDTNINPDIIVASNNNTSNNENVEQEVCGTISYYDVYTVTDHYETYIEEELPQYVGEPSTEEIVGSKYFRDYMSAYSNYFPEGLPTSLDFRVLENENISKLIYDDVPGQIGGSVQVGDLVGQTFAAEFSAYYPDDDPMQGGYHDAKGEKLDPSKNTCAAPWTEDYPKSLLTYGSRIQIKGTGTAKDGVVCTINDKGSKITLEEQADGSLKYKIDILFPDKKSAYDFGRRQGQIVIESANAPAPANIVYDNPVERLMNNYQAAQSRTLSLIVNTGGNAVTNYGMTIDDYANKRGAYMAGKSCDSNNCTTANYRANLEPMAYQDKVGDLRHLRLDIYRPVNEAVFNKMFSEKFSVIGQYGGALIEAGKKTNVDILAKAAQMALESGWGKRAIIGTKGGKTYYNFAGIGAYDGDAYNKGLQYAMKEGWDTPEKGMIGVIEFVSKKYIYNEEYKQNTLYKFQFTPSDYKRFYASAPDYSYSIANIMQNSIIKKYPDIYAPNATYYFDFPEFDPNKPVGTVEGAGYVPGGGGSYSTGGTPSTAFNSYLATNWSAVESNWDELFPGQTELDEKLDLVKKGDYTELYSNYEKKAKAALEPGNQARASTFVTLPRNNNKFSSKMTEVDKQLALNMMFALNQGNYLFKYDRMTEMEWKAMYTQLLSSPTGKTWDDKWIGFTKKDIFGIDDIGKLFKEDAAVSPVISVPYGMEKNNFSDDVTKLTQYNYTNFGIDIVVPPETEVLTVADGEVIAMSNKNDVSSRYGNYVEIRHANDTVTVTANLKEIKVKVGQKLTKGDVIGKSGGDCKSYKDNALHYQIRHKGSLINPTWIITGDMTGYEDPIVGNNGVICGTSASLSDTISNPVVAQAISIAKQQIGKPYVWGATGPNSFDCSGFMYYIMKQAGVEGGRNVAYGYYKASVEVPREQIQPGDFVFWHDLKGTRHSPVYHIGVYMGNGEVIDCSTDHNGVGTRKLEDLVDKPGNRRFTFGRYEKFVGSTGSIGGISSGGGGCMAPSNTNSVTAGGFKWPVPSVSDYKKSENGIDIPATKGTEIVASKAGTVEVSELQDDYGNVIYIKHDDGSQTRYAYNDKNLVKVGDVVTQGQVIAKVGSTGKSEGNNLHFEIRLGDEALNPAEYVKP